MAEILVPGRRSTKRVQESGRMVGGCAALASAKKRAKVPKKVVSESKPIEAVAAEALRLDRRSEVPRYERGLRDWTGEMARLREQVKALARKMEMR